MIAPSASARHANRKLCHYEPRAIDAALATAHARLRARDDFAAIFSRVPTVRMTFSTRRLRQKDAAAPLSRPRQAISFTTPATPSRCRRFAAGQLLPASTNTAYFFSTRNISLPPLIIDDISLLDFVINYQDSAMRHSDLTLR